MAHIFIGSSTQSLRHASTVEDSLEGAGHRPILWPKAFEAGSWTFGELNRIAREVDGALLVFASDDLITAGGVTRRTTRDNVVLEYGLFVGALGPESVRCVIVGEPNLPSDLLGLVSFQFSAPSSPDGGATQASPPRELLDWANALLPSFLKSLSYERLRDFEEAWRRRGERSGYPSRVILQQQAPALIRKNPGDKICAVCSDKGKYGPQYYDHQFQWAREKAGRKVQRIFLCNVHEEEGAGFSEDERLAILDHLDHKSDGVEIKWIAADHPLVGERFSNKLGFAVFGESWLLHWGTERGLYHDASRPRSEGGDLCKLLASRFKVLWDQAEEFTDELIGTIADLTSPVRDARQRASRDPEENP